MDRHTQTTPLAPGRRFLTKNLHTPAPRPFGTRRRRFLVKNLTLPTSTTTVPETP
jgi:hypothetical protein